MKTPHPGTRPASRLVLLGALPALLWACSEAPQPTPPLDGPQACAIERLDAQQTDRLAVGTTFFLPQSPDCDGLAWTLDEAPDGNLNEVVQGRDGFDRFTPIEPGEYRFTLGESTETIRVIRGDDLPFEHHNYYPTASQALVDGELWVANVYTPTVTRLDPSTLDVLGEIQVGAWPVAIAWRAGMPHALVVQRGGDTLGLIDTTTKTLTDAIHVGDEPSNIALSPDGSRAYVTLSTEAKVAIVDLIEGVVTKVPTGVDPLGLALSSDGARLFVASHRSGHPERSPHEDDPVDEERDITVIDTEKSEVLDHFLDLGTTINALHHAPDADRLYVARTRNDTLASLADPDEPSFFHEIALLDSNTGEEIAVADVTRQAGSGGFAVSLHAMALDGDTLWVAAESSDLVVALDAEDLSEQRRAEAPGRPRHVLAAEGQIFVHGAQGFVLTAFDADAEPNGEASTGPDPRSEAVAFGQRYFTGAGRDFAQNWACNSCHSDGLTDTLIWNAGPFSDRVVSRPFFWLEGTYRLGWAGYMSNVRNYAFEVNTNVGIRPNTEEAESLAAYISSLLPPPAANHLTQRDGSLSEAGVAGAVVYERACASCHPLPLTTNRQSFPEGITEGVSDVPALVGVYRHNVWLKDGSARTMRAAVVAALEYVGQADTSDADIDALTRYMGELTGRDFFVLTSTPERGEGQARVDATITLTFSRAVFDEAANLARIKLLDGSGQAVEAEVEVDARKVRLSPAEVLEHGAEYTVEIEEGFEAQNERPIFEAARIAFTTADAPEVALNGDFILTVNMPLPFEDFSGFNPEITVPVLVPVQATEANSGASAVLDYAQGLVYSTNLVVSGSKLQIPPVPLPVGPSFTDSLFEEAELLDTDDDGLADEAEGTLTISGPGFVVPGIAWRLARVLPDAECPAGSEGEPLVSLIIDIEGRPEVHWEGEDDAIALFVTDPGAQLPFGPGQTVSGGAAYWGLQTSDFPNGFPSPVTYGVVPEGADDVSEDNGAPAGGAALEEGRCYTFSVVTTGFQITSFTRRW